MKLKETRHQLDRYKEISGVASSVEEKPRTGNIESDHQGRSGLSTKRKKENAMEPGQQGLGKEGRRGSVAGASWIAIIITFILWCVMHPALASSRPSFIARGVQLNPRSTSSTEHHSELW